jgi:hypothetical protein
MQPLSAIKILITSATEEFQALKPSAVANSFAIAIL